MASDFGFKPVLSGKRYFISYKSEDEERVGAIARRLNERGVPLWYDYGIEKGKHWNREITKNIRDCEAVVMFVTKRLLAAEDTYVRTEYDLAGEEGYGKKIYIVFLDNVSFKDVHENLKDWFFEIRRLQGIEAYSLSDSDEIAWWIVESFNLIHTKEPQLSIQQQTDRKLTTQQVQVGDRLTFGRYDGEREPIEWRVLAVEDGKALVITEKLLDCVSYNKKYTEVTWETCSLRKWMNEDFYNSSFTDDEKSKIAEVTLSNPDNPDYGTEGGNDTQDKVFALSIDEAKKYFSSDSDRKAYMTYASDYETYYSHSERYGYGNINMSHYYRLRSPGYDRDLAAIVNYDGDVYTFGLGVDYVKVAARSALWLNL